MGNFIALSGIIGKTQNEVIKSLTSYTTSVGGGIQQDNTLNSNNNNYCIVEEANGNTTIFYPDGYLEWDETSEFISRELHSSVFSFHIHDGDLWMYLLYNNGDLVDMFNPIPDYWDENISQKDINNWKGDASIITQYVPYVKKKDIEKYLVRWDLDEEESTKAYPTDEFAKEEWQLVDFMTKLRLPYPFDNTGNPTGQTYKFWTEKLPLVSATKSQNYETEIKVKPWWKFW